jgi:putative transposase
MPWEGVTVSEQRQNFIRDYIGGCYSRTELAQAFSISRKTAYKWINWFKGEGKAGLQEHSRRPRSRPWQTEAKVAEAIVSLWKVRPSMGPKKLREVLRRRHPG